MKLHHWHYLFSCDSFVYYATLASLLSVKWFFSLPGLLWLAAEWTSDLPLGDQTAGISRSYWSVTVLMYSAELELAHVAQTGWSALSLLRFSCYNFKPTILSTLLGYFAPLIFCCIFYFNLIVKEIWHLPSFSSCQPLSPKYHFLPDKTLDLLVLTRGIFRSGDVLGIFWVISWAKHAESSVVEMNYSPSFIITKDLKGEWESLLFL